jgi:hypothetical protein
MTWTVSVTQTSTGYAYFDTEEEARKWIAAPDLDAVNWKYVEEDDFKLTPPAPSAPAQAGE